VVLQLQKTNKNPSPHSILKKLRRITMKINDDYLKEQLKNVYWLNGGCCAGKSTMTKKFVKELGFLTLEDNVMNYRPFTNPVDYPALSILIRV